MPKALEEKLKREAKGFSKERKNAYVYGTLRKKTGWVPNTQKKKRKYGK